MRVLKFGGTSVADAERLRRVARLVDSAARCEPVVMVVSALAGVTDTLADLATRAAEGMPHGERLASLIDRHFAALDALEERPDGHDAVRRVLEELDRALSGIGARRACDAAERDALLACGERLSVVLAAAALTAAGFTAVIWDARKLVVTDSRFGRAAVDLPRTWSRLRRAWRHVTVGCVPVAAGFIGADRHGRTTTLGRGGSDTSASVIGAALHADAVEIWTDVDGVLSAPPASSAPGHTLPRLSWEEALQVARFGGKVLHPDTMAPAARAGIPIRVRNTFRPAGPLTVVGPPTRRRWDGALAVTCVESATLVGLPATPERNLLAPALGALPCHGPAPFPHAEVRLAPSELDAALVAAGRVRHGVSVVAVVAEGIAQRPETHLAVREVLRRARIPIVASVDAASSAALAVVVPRGLRHEAVRALHGALVAPLELGRPTAAEGGERHG
jgi:bifunctional aspartokinase / homoserine dehydrogenase 1